MKPRHHLYLDDDLTQQLERLGSKPGTSKSAIVSDALRDYLNRRATREVDDLLKTRLDRISTQLGRIERNGQVLLETLSLFVRYQLKTPYRDGTTHVIFEPLDFIARLAALVPKPRVNLTRFHGVFAPHSRHRALVTPAKRGRGNKVRVADEPATPAQRRASMTWAQRLKRVFNIDIETCSGCGGAMKVIACIEDPIVIKQILDHLKHKAETSGTRALPESRAPPAELLLGLFD